MGSRPNTWPSPLALFVKTMDTMLNVIQKCKKNWPIKMLLFYSNIKNEMAVLFHNKTRAPLNPRNILGGWKYRWPGPKNMCKSRGKMRKSCGNYMVISKGKNPWKIWSEKRKQRQKSASIWHEWFHLFSENKNDEINSKYFWNKIWKMCLHNEIESFWRTCLRKIEIVCSWMVC